MRRWDFVGCAAVVNQLAAAWMWLTGAIPLSTVHSYSLQCFLLFCETHDLVWEIISVSEKRMKNCKNTMQFFIRKMYDGAALRRGSSCENRFVSKRCHSSFNNALRFKDKVPQFWSISLLSSPLRWVQQVSTRGVLFQVVATSPAPQFTSNYPHPPRISYGLPATHK